MTEFSAILGRLGDGELQAMDELLQLVECELRSLATARLRRERADITLNVTELVNEAYLRLAGRESLPNWQNRAHFFGAASEAMRRILVDHVRKKRSQKRGGDIEQVQMQTAFLAAESRTDELLAVHDALDELEEHDPPAAELVKLRYFAGMKHHEAADAMGISKRVADRLWVVAKTWLFRKLKSRV